MKHEKAAYPGYSSAQEMPVELRAISATEIFLGLSEGEIQAVLAQGNRYKQFTGGYVYQVEQKQSGLYFLENGGVEEFRLTAEGQRLPISRIVAGQFFGFASTKSMYCCFAQATAESTVWFISFQDLEKVFRKHPAVAVNLVRWLANRLGEIEERIEAISFRQLRARVARYLLKLCGSQDTDLIEITHEQLSLWVSGSRPKVSTILQEFHEAGAVELSRGKILVLNRNLLENLAQQAS